VAFVLDASSTLPWCFQDEATSETKYLLDLATEYERIYVPAHWPMEILNGLSRAARRGRLDDNSVDDFLKRLPGYNIFVDRTPLPQQLSEARKLVVRYRLSAYDAAYLALASRLGVTLATLDAKLRLAAKAEGVGLTI